MTVLTTLPASAPAFDTAIGGDFLPRGGCSADPYVEIAVDVIQGALRELRKWWQEDKPIYRQPQEAQEALAFLVFGIEGPLPFLYHELVGLESVAEMEPAQSITLFLNASRRRRIAANVAD